LVVVDKLSEAAYFLTLTHPFTAKGVVEKFMEGIIKLNELPKSIISDLDLAFIKRFYKKNFKFQAPSYNLALPIIRKSTTKQKWSTAM